MKKKSFMLLVLLLLISITPCTASAARRIRTIKCDGKLISNEYFYGVERDDGTVLIPYKTLSRAEVAPLTKVSVKYSESKKRLTIERNNIVIELYRKQKQFVKNNEFKYQLPCTLRFYQLNGKKRLCFPAEIVCKLLGFKYSYNKATNTLSLTSKKPITNYNATMGTKPFLLMSTEEFVEAIGPIAQNEYHKSGILASVTIAQAIEESWSGVSYLAQNGNNLFGMKCYLSGNTWKGSTWRGAKVVKKTKEQYGSRVVTITDSFRKYDNVGQSFADHSAYFLNAKNEYGAKRYKGLTDTKSYRKQIDIIMRGGYCTFDIYGQELIDLIKDYNLTRFDK